MQCRVEAYKIRSFLDWDKRKQLNLLPRFQRRDVWSPNYKSYFLDTLVRELPTSSIFVREKISDSKITTIEVVDGQQRLRTILDFLRDDQIISTKYNKEYGGKKFSELPTEVQKRFLDYELSVSVLTNASDVDVLDIFARLNTFTVRLNKQELRNARYHGEFKSLAYRLASESIQFFMDNAILGPRQIVRMADAELVSELLVAMDLGLQDKKGILDSYYKRNDDEYPRGQILSEQYLEIVKHMTCIFADSIRETRIRGKSLFFSLFCVLYDLLYGLPGQGQPVGMIPERNYKKARQSLVLLGEQASREHPPIELVEFADACKRHTNDIGPRQTRHNVIKSIVLPLVEQ